MLLLAVLTGLGFGGAFIAGLLGVGGAILMIPLLLYTPPWLGLAALDMRTVAAMSMAQVFFAALSGAIAHGRHGSVHASLALSVGVSAIVASLGGGIASRWIPSQHLLVAFALMATLGALLMWGAPAEVEGAETHFHSFSKPRAIAIGLGVGLLGGLVGAGGAFLTVPLLLTVLRIPTRVAIATSLAITLGAASAGFLGKLMTGQIPLALTAALVLGAIPGAQVGAWVSRRSGLRALRGILAVITSAVAARTWYDVLVRLG